MEPKTILVPTFKDEPKRSKEHKAYKSITKEENERLSLKTQRDNKLVKIIYKNQRNILKTHWASSIGCKETRQNKSRSMWENHTEVESDNSSIK